MKVILSEKEYKELIDINNEYYNLLNELIKVVSFNYITDSSDLERIIAEERIVDTEKVIELYDKAHAILFNKYM